MEGTRVRGDMWRRVGWGGGEIKGRASQVKVEKCSLSDVNFEAWLNPPPTSPKMLLFFVGLFSDLEVEDAEPAVPLKQACFRSA